MSSSTQRRLAVVLVAAVAIVIAAVLLSESGTTEKVDDSERVALFAGIPQDGAWLGREDAPVVVEEYADLQCPFCADFATRNLPPIVEDYVRDGTVRMRLRLLTFLGPDSVKAGQMAAATGLQNLQWDFTEAFFARQGQENSGYVDEDFLRDTAAEVEGLDVDRAFADSDDPGALAQLREDAAAAQSARVESTPSFLVGKRDGRLRPTDANGLLAAIEAALGA